MSNFKQKEMKSPGKTISPRPTILLEISPSAFKKGKTSLIGRSRFLATVTITSVPQTQKISQKKRAQSRRSPVLVVLRFRLFRATTEKRTPKMLLRAQCRVTKQNPTGTHTIAMQMILATESSNFLASNRSCRKEGILHEKMTYFILSGKGKSSAAIPEIDITMVTEKQQLTMPINTSFGRNLQRRQIPKRNADATRGNCLASLIPITASLPYKFLLQLTMRPVESLVRRVDNKHPMQTQAQVLRSNCKNTGMTKSPPAMLVPRSTAYAKTKLRTGWRPTLIIIFNLYL